MTSKKRISGKLIKSIDNALEAIIDQWYLSVSDYYITPEKKANHPNPEQQEELKRFHDEAGHRIKFNKGELDFTYGLSVQEPGETCILEASINNKVPRFNYSELVRRLSTYYEGAREKSVEGFKQLKDVRNRDVFVLQEDFQNSITVEQREGKADIVRLSFAVQGDHLEDLVANPAEFMELIHQYCVAPLRRIYAEVFRTKRR